VTVVLLHALPLDERMWEPQRTVVPDAVAPRLYGRGASLDAWAESIAGEVDGELGLVGASMGGYCSLELARREPERVRVPNAFNAELREFLADV
jgi:pimeloyl-ACP methyl ester carboxylesterase